MSKEVYKLHFKWFGQKYKVDDVKYFNTLEEANKEKKNLAFLYLNAFNENDNKAYTTDELYQKARKLANEQGNTFNIRIYKN